MFQKKQNYRLFFNANYTSERKQISKIVGIGYELVSFRSTTGLYSKIQLQANNVIGRKFWSSGTVMQATQPETV